VLTQGKSIKNEWDREMTEFHEGGEPYKA